MDSAGGAAVQDPARPQDEIVPLVIGVTGHRDLVPDEVPRLRALVREFLETLQTKYPDLPLVVMSPLAEGADRLVAEEARKLGIPLMVPLPFPRAIYEQDFKTPESLQSFRSLCEGAEVIELPLLNGDTAASVADPGPRRDAHYARLGVFLCAHCHILLALWDGKPSDKLGGASQVVWFHHWDEMPGLIERDESRLQILAEDESDLVYHIVCSRDQPDGAPAEGLRPLELWWFTTDAEEPRSRVMPPRYESVFERAAEFNRDATNFGARIESEGWSLLPADAPPEVQYETSPVNAVFMAADWLANHFQRRVTWALRVLYTLAAMMALAFVAYGTLQQIHVLVVLFLACFIAGLVIYRVAERGAWHRKYLDYRALAEGLRVQFYWVAAGVTASRVSKFTHDNFLQKQDVELGWIRNVMRHTGRRGDVFPGTRSGLEFTLREWVGTPHPGTGQLAYYQRKAVERSALRRQTVLIGTFCLWTGVVIAIALLLFQQQMRPGWKDLLLLLMGVLPLVAALREAYAQKRAEKELIKQYQFMARIFSNARRQLESAPSDAARRKTLKALGDAALEDHAQWLLMHRERPLEHGRIGA